MWKVSRTEVLDWPVAILQPNDNTLILCEPLLLSLPVSLFGHSKKVYSLYEKFVSTGTMQIKVRNCSFCSQIHPNMLHASDPI